MSTVIQTDRESLREATSFTAKVEARHRARQREKVIEEAFKKYHKRPLTTDDFSMVDQVAMKGDGLRMRWPIEALAAFDTSGEF